MIRVNIHDAKTHLSRYLAQVEKGETIVLCKRNTPIAEIRLLPERRPRRKIGLCKGMFEIPPEFYEPMSDEELALWYDAPILSNGDL
jgi:antitoxin (DNA-binding transcriptional repressor) of toxin-antitoxin stability system